jgi:hypothetical protein
MSAQTTLRTALERFVLDFLQSAEIAETTREPEQRFFEIPCDYLRRARQLAKQIERTQR